MTGRHDPDAPAPAPPSALAAVALHGPALRYAEVEPGPRPHDPGRLRRLGTCDFDFAVDEAVLGLTGPTYLDTVIEAVREIFRGTSARSLLVAVHPPALTGFFAPLPEALGAPERYEQLRQEAALLADVSTAQPVRIRAVPVRTEALAGEPHRWHHVLHVPEPVHARLSLIAKALGVNTYDLVDATHAAASVVRALDANQAAPPPPFTLALGAYAGHTELALVHEGAWHHGHHVPGRAPEDAAYFAAALLDRLGLQPAQVRRVLLYGEEADPARYGLLADLFQTTPTLLDPLAVYGRTPPEASPTLLAAYVPCVGALLR